MIALIGPHPSQLRYYAESALNSFDTLSDGAAISHAKDELRALLAYLETFADYSVPILGGMRVEPWISLERKIG